LKAGAERLELDVHATSDGVVVVLHDETLERTTEGTGAVRALPLAAVERLDAGYRFRAPDGTYPYRDRGLRVPTLAALLEAFPGVPLNIEIKQREPPIEAAVLATLDRFAARERTLLAAEDPAVMARIRAAAPDVLTSFSAAEVADFVFRLPETVSFRAGAGLPLAPTLLGQAGIRSPEPGLDNAIHGRARRSLAQLPLELVENRGKTSAENLKVK